MNQSLLGFWALYIYFKTFVTKTKFSTPWRDAPPALPSPHCCPLHTHSQSHTSTYSTEPRAPRLFWLSDPTPRPCTAHCSSLVSPMSSSPSLVGHTACTALSSPLSRSATAGQGNSREPCSELHDDTPGVTAAAGRAPRLVRGYHWYCTASPARVDFTSSLDADRAAPLGWEGGSETPRCWPLVRLSTRSADKIQVYILCATDSKNNQGGSRLGRRALDPNQS